VQGTLVCRMVLVDSLMLARIDGDGFLRGEILEFGCRELRSGQRTFFAVSRRLDAMFSFLRGGWSFCDLVCCSGVRGSNLYI
jgi:hypothetical protein